LRFLASWRSCEGFTLDDINEMREAFSECEGPERKADSEAVIHAGELSNGLLNFAGLHSSQHLTALLDKLEESLESDHSVPVSFYEFLACCRMVRALMVKEVHGEFKKLDTDKDGFIDVADLRRLCIPLGFTLVDAEWEELLEAQSVPEDAWLELDTVWSFVQAVREQNGFTEQTQEELTECFNKFCDDSGEMPNLQVMELLSYMGFEATIDEVRQMVKRVDFNGNGTMDSGEFLCLMRFQREANMADYKAAFEDKQFAEEGTASFPEILKALEDCKIKAEPSLLRETLEECIEQGLYDKATKTVSFNGFLFIAQTMLNKYPVELRKRANFKDVDLMLIENTFKSQEKGKGFITTGELIWLLQDSELGVNSLTGRSQLFDNLDKAREAAVASGIEPAMAGNPGSPRVRLMPLVHFVRLCIKEHQDKVFEREDRVMAAVSFSEREVVEFRQLFNTLATQAGTREPAPAPQPTSPSAPSMRRRASFASLPSAQTVAVAEPARPMNSAPKTLGAVISQFKHVIRVPVQDVLDKVAGMNTKVPSSQKLALGDAVMRYACGNGGLDFPGFLQVMQWMIDSNFGNIKERGLA